jgi:hypothetical protein
MDHHCCFCDGQRTSCCGTDRPTQCQEDCRHIDTHWCCDDELCTAHHIYRARSGLGAWVRPAGLTTGYQLAWDTSDPWCRVCSSAVTSCCSCGSPTKGLCVRTCRHRWDPAMRCGREGCPEWAGAPMPSAHRYVCADGVTRWVAPDIRAGSVPSQPPILSASQSIARIQRIAAANPHLTAQLENIAAATAVQSLSASDAHALLTAALAVVEEDLDPARQRRSVEDLQR